MKILHVSEASGAGVSRHLLDLVGGQMASGHDVTVIWSRRRADPFYIERLTSIPNIRTQEIDMRRSLGPHDLGSLRAITEFVRETGPYDIIHGHSSKAGALTRLLPRSLGGVQIYTAHAFRTYDPGLSRPARLVFTLAERLLALRTDRIIVASLNERDHARSIGLPEAKLALAFNGSGPDHRMTREQAREAMGLGPDDMAVGYVGRLEYQKDPLRFIRAFRAAQPHCDRLVGVMIGDGDLREQCEAEARGLRIRFLGWKDGPMLMKGFDFYCMTSLYDSCAYTLGEAIHDGVPCITTEVGGALDWIRHGETGVILPVDVSPEAMGAEIAALACDPARIKEWSKRCQLTAPALTADRMVERILEIYAETIAKKQGLRGERQA